ncbi:MAG TPA: methyltransferase [Candidatus Gemmiger avistercoris]|uniref:Methyltransferase n=1 Tax=Candidatus Gemmiger avistercoris TaxID=2838606 RepID=A0A9D2FJL5_9FIRM|nr:methyltransferase [uncultured Subdoligranulum sp.]HIZ61860.1 methyltransferase [Candidatus Gemmiger avistercoris]
MNRAEVLDHGTRVCTAPRAGFGTDALLLARFAAPRPRERALDLCSGCGIVALVWHDGGHRGPCTAVELDPAASALCAASLRENGIGHITPLCADLRAFCRTGPEQGRYDLAACNPPYFTAGPRSPDPVRAIARHADTCTLADAAQAAARALREGGRFALCQRPDQLAEVLCALRAVRLEPKRLAFVRQRAGRVPGLFLVEAQKGRRPGLRLEPDILIEAGAARYGETKGAAAAPGQKQQ